ncbi:MAG TPA: hypothetical protein PK521_02900, partial [Bacteroidales bacterium]|nr:hypothetical protein [Bacteroidales bacterium]
KILLIYNTLTATRYFCIKNSAAFVSGFTSADLKLIFKNFVLFSDLPGILPRSGYGIVERIILLK